MKKINVLLALLFLFAFVGCGGDDEDTSTSTDPCTSTYCNTDCAIPAAFGEAIEGKLSKSGAHYVVNIPEAGILEITSSNIPEKVKLTTEILKSDCKPVSYYDAEATGKEGTGYTFAYGIKEPGDYIIRFTDENFINQGNFNFNLNLYLDDVYEFNENCDSAAQVELGQDIKLSLYPRRDEDKFKVNVAKAGVLKISVKNVPAEMVIDGSLMYAEQCRAINIYQSVFTSKPGKEVDFVYPVEPGEYIIDLKSNFQNSPQLFDLNISIDNNDIYENNNSCDNAKLAPFGEEISSAIYPTKDKDYFKIEVADAGVLKFEAYDVPNEIRLKAEILDQNCLWNRDYMAPAKGSGLSFTYNVDPGTYYINLGSELSLLESSPELFKFKVTMQ